MSNETNPYLMNLVTSLHITCMQQLGKLANPFSGKIDRDLDQATHTIELIRALRQKTEGNLSAEELKIIDNTIFELQMNYLDETKKEPTERAKKPDDKNGDATTQQESVKD